jgi:hypothetical protein
LRTLENILRDDNQAISLFISTESATMPRAKSGDRPGLNNPQKKSVPLKERFHRKAAQGCDSNTEKFDATCGLTPGPAYGQDREGYWFTRL